MGTYAEGVEEVSFLTRSVVRARLLSELHRGGAAEVHELRDRFDCDRTTLQRNLDALVDHGWVRRTTNTYRTTLVGDLLAGELTEFVDAVGEAVELESLLRWMPPEEFDLDVEHLLDADVTVANHRHPYGAVSKHVDLLRNSDRFRGLVPSVGRHALETAWRRVSNGEGRFEVVITAEGTEVLQSEPAYAELFGELLDSDRVEVRTYDGELPFYLGLSEDVVQIGVENDDGMRRALLETDRDAVHAWAESTFERYTGQARPLDSVGT